MNLADNIKSIPFDSFNEAQVVKDILLPPKSRGKYYFAALCKFHVVEDTEKYAFFSQIC